MEPPLFVIFHGVAFFCVCMCATALSVCREQFVFRDHFGRPFRFDETIKKKENISVANNKSTKPILFTRFVSIELRLMLAELYQSVQHLLGILYQFISILIDGQPKDITTKENVINWKTVGGYGMTIESQEILNAMHFE